MTDEDIRRQFRHTYHRRNHRSTTIPTPTDSTHAPTWPPANISSASLNPSIALRFAQGPDASLKARRPAQGLTSWSRLNLLLKARCSAQGPTLRSRPDAPLKARRSAQGPKLCLRPDAPLKARSSAQGLTLRSRTEALLKARHST
ncbi:hypothetical protein M5K25_017534 [Dendrobium thyrsiflorum]|uniref:Uncharacterized protein n=1 Tax=Dendrobium thyrsiflorum TaxID=117978 RepID=A0ABD0UUP7_DENTH